MPQRQPRLGDILDDYCPRERRLTNHAVVAMIGDEVKQTRCTTCDAEHEYKHARVPRQRKKADAPAALYAQGVPGGPKRVSHDAEHDAGERGRAGEDAAPAQTSGPEEHAEGGLPDEAPSSEHVPAAADAAGPARDDDRDEQTPADGSPEEGPVHRPLIRATLPRQEGQPPAQRPVPQFTIRQPGGRPGRFRPRNQRGPFAGNRSNGNVAGPMRSDSMRGGRPNAGGGGMGRPGRRHGHKRTK